MQNKLWQLPLQSPDSATTVVLSSPLLSSQAEESERDGNEVILSSTFTSMTKLGSATSNGTADMDDSAEKQLAVTFIWRGEEASHIFFCL
jgi:hypothetical protein